MNRFETIKSYNDKIKELLQERPELIHLQEQIDEKLNNVSDKRERCRILQELMLSKWYEITEV